MFNYSGTTYLLKKSDLTWEGGEVISLFYITTSSFLLEKANCLYTSVFGKQNRVTNVIIAMNCEI